MAKAACAAFPNVDVILDFGFVADYCKKAGIPLLVRGVRGEEDLPFERMAADYNRARGVETLLFFAEGDTATLSSTEVRQKIAKGETADGLVPAEILPFLRKKSAK